MYVNAGHASVMRALERPSDDGNREIGEAIRFDVGRQLIERALDCEELVGEVEFPEGSLGVMLRRLLALHWPSETPAALAARRRMRPAEFQTELNARLGPFTNV